jgi:trimethylamine:corrinoid methyltransferase-like protein
LRKARELLAEYEQPQLDPAVDEALLAFIQRRKSEISPNQL